MTQTKAASGVWCHYCFATTFTRIFFIRRRPVLKPLLSCIPSTDDIRGCLKDRYASRCEDVQAHQVREGSFGSSNILETSEPFKNH